MERPAPAPLGKGVAWLLAFDVPEEGGERAVAKERRYWAVQRAEWHQHLSEEDGDFEASKV